MLRSKSRKSCGCSIAKSGTLLLAFSSLTAVALVNGSFERTMVRIGVTECEYFSPADLAKLVGMLLLT